MTQTTDLEQRLRDYASGLGGDGDLRVGPRMCIDALTEAADELARLRAENDKLRSALEPFAEYAAKDGFGLDNNGQEIPASEGVGWIYLTVGDFRRARAAMKGSSHE